jgi:hypothetical protein
MKFKIRAPFVVHVHSVVVSTDITGKKIKSGKTDSHQSGEIIDLDLGEARRHLHKLEPADEEATAFLETIHEKNREIARHRMGVPSPTDPAFIAAVAAQVAAALRENGAVSPPAKR